MEFFREPGAQKAEYLAIRIVDRGGEEQQNANDPAVVGQDGPAIAGGRIRHRMRLASWTGLGRGREGPRSVESANAIIAGRAGRGDDGLCGESRRRL